MVRPHFLLVVLVSLGLGKYLQQSTVVRHHVIPLIPDYSDLRVSISSHLRTPNAFLTQLCAGRHQHSSVYLPLPMLAGPELQSVVYFALEEIVVARSLRPILLVFRKPGTPAFGSPS